MLDQKIIQVIFLFEFKMGHKAAETACNINNASGLGAANERTVQWWFKKFCRRDEGFEDKECRGQPSDIDNDQLRAIIEAEPLTTAWQAAEELNTNRSTAAGIWSKLYRWKRLISGCLLKLAGNFKSVILKCFSYFGVGNGNPLQYPCLENSMDRGVWRATVHRVAKSWKWLRDLHTHTHTHILILCNNEPFLNRIVLCDEKQILYNDNQWWPTQWLDQEEAPKHFPKPNLHQKKGMVTLWWCLIHYSFLNPGKTITSEKYSQQTDEMHWKLQCLLPT